MNNEIAIGKITRIAVGIINRVLFNFRVPALKDSQISKNKISNKN
jgi:hypothetical protein